MGLGMATWMREIMRWIGAAMGVCVMACAAGCGSSVSPPAGVKDPVTVYLLDTGRTSSVVLPLPGPSPAYVRWTFGQWDWYALEKDGPLDALPVLFCPSQGTLGRQSMRPPRPGESPADAFGRQLYAAHAEHVHELEVERSQAAALQSKLDVAFASEAKTQITGKSSRISFVHYDRKYAGWSNSNHQTGDWLRELGCEVRGCGFLSDWSIVRPTSASPD